MKSFALLASWLWAGAAVAGQLPVALRQSPEAGEPRFFSSPEAGEPRFFSSPEAGGPRLAQLSAEPAPASSGGLRKGKVHMETWASDIQFFNLAAKIGGGPFYMTVLAGLEPGRDARFTFGAGLGGHVTLARRLWLDMDITGGAVQPVQKPLEGDGGNVLGQARLMLGFQLLPRLAVFAGPTYNAWFVWGEPDFDSITRMSVNESQPKPDQRLQHWPGLQVGLHI